MEKAGLKLLMDDAAVPGGKWDGINRKSDEGQGSFTTNMFFKGAE